MQPEASRSTMETLFSLIHPEDQASVRETMQNAPARGGCSQIDHRIILPDGTERFLRQIAEPLGKEAGRGRLLVTVQDVTEYGVHSGWKESPGWLAVLPMTSTTFSW